MAFDSTKLRDAIRPGDSVAIIITLLGVAIAIFLGDAMIKFIGGSIAFLGGMALYMTVRQRMNDQVQIRSRRSTLPPPAFKTRVTHEPGSTTKRIFFDDFKETFKTADDDLEAVPETESGEGFTVKSGAAETRPKTPAAEPKPAAESRPIAEPKPAPTPKPSAEPAAPRAIPSFDDVEEETTADFIPGDEGSFRVVKGAKPAASNNAGGASRTETAPHPVAPAAEPQPRTEPKTTPATSKPRAEAAPAVMEQPAPAAPAPAEREPETFEPVTLTAPVEEVQTERMPTRKQVQMMLDDLTSEPEDDSKSSEPRAEFVRLVGQVLNAIARSIPARSIVFCWINTQKRHLIPEAQVTSGGYEIRTGARLPLGGDVVSQIARSGIPEILTDISPAAERELIPYYAGPADTRSFVGVPVFFRREVVGVLVADSSEENGFDEGDVATLAEYTRLISGLIRGYTEKYDLHLTAKTLDAFEQMHRAFTGTARTPQQIADILIDQITALFDALYAGVVLFDVDRREWCISAYAALPERDDVGQLEPEMNGSLIGDCARFAEEIYIEQLAGEVRVSPLEPPNDAGSFLALPLVGTTKCYGAVALEHGASSAYIPRDIDLLRDLVRYAALAIEVYNVNQAIETQSVLDETSGLYNSDFLLSILDREVIRARDFRKPLSFGLISIDMPASLRVESASELEEVIVSNVGSIISANVRPYDIIGRFDTRTFGVVLVERNDQDAYLWAERLRKEVASKILSAGNRKFSVTISVGICDMSDLQNNGSIIKGASQALEKARSGDGNAVILY